LPLSYKLLDLFKNLVVICLELCQSATLPKREIETPAIYAISQARSSKAVVSRKSVMTLKQLENHEKLLTQLPFAFDDDWTGKWASIY
jgi:hypothetical protein